MSNENAAEFMRCRGLHVTETSDPRRCALAEGHNGPHNYDTGQRADDRDLVVNPSELKRAEETKAWFDRKLSVQKLPVTEKEQFTAMLTRAGVEWKGSTAGDDIEPLPTGATIVRIRQGDDGKTRGHIGFYTDFEFSPDGHLLRVGLWE